MNTFPCKCTHEFSDHFEIEFRKRESDWPCRVCSNDFQFKPCLDYIEIDNLKFLEMKATGEI
jgi:hypothetical protein